MSQDLFYDPEYGLSWWMIYVDLKIKYILMLSEIY